MDAYTSPLAFFLVLLITSASVLLAGCAQEGDDGKSVRDQETITALQDRARMRPPAAEANFGYIHHLQDLEISPNQPLVVTTEDGSVLSLSHVALVISAIELHRCAPTNNARGSLLELLLPTAHAHVPSSATRFGTPWVEELIATAGQARMIGGIAPPFGTYCELHVILAPADDDVVNITAIEPEDLDGHSLIIRGSFRRADEEDFHSFEWTSNRSGVAVLPMIDPHTGLSPVELLRPEQQLLLLLDKTLSHEQFQSVEIRSDSTPDFSAFFDALIESFSIYQYH